MHKKIIALCALQLIALLTFASEQTIAQKKSASQQIEKLKEHIPLPEIQKIVLEYVGNEYLPTHFDKVKRISATAVSANGKYLMIASQITGDISNKQDTAKIWKFENGKYVLIGNIIFPITAYESGAAAISDDGKYIAMSAQHGNIYSGQLSQGKYIENQVENTSEKPSSLQFFENHNYLGLRTLSHGISVLELSNNKRFNPIQTFGQQYSSRPAAFSENGEYVVTGENNEIQLWKMLMDKFTLLNKTAIGDLLDAIAISNDNKYVVSANGAKVLEIFKLQDNTLQSLQKIKLGSYIRLIKFSPDSTHLAIARSTVDKPWQTVIDIYKLNQKSQKYEHISTLPHDDFNKDPYQLIGFSPNNEILTATFGSEITIWENQKEQLEQDAGEKIKTAAEQEQPVVTEVD